MKRVHPTGGVPLDRVASPISSDAAKAGVTNAVFVRLVLMMLLEFAVFGSWFATFGLVLATYGMSTSIGVAYALAAVAAIISPMFLGAIGDRFLASQKSLGLAHIAGGAVMLALPAVVESGNRPLTLGLIFGYALFFQPTLGLANSVAFRHLGSDQGRFPYVRVFGTIGWVVAGIAVGVLGLSASADLFYLTAAISLAFGAYAFTLPQTPPPAYGVRFAPGDIVGSKAFVMFRHRNFAVLMLCAVLTAISLGFYNTFASTYLDALGMHDVATVLALGQAMEVLFIVSIPFVLKRIGMKWGLLLGMVMWAVRFALFIAAAGGQHWLAVLAVALQGICNDFFLVLAAMYIDKVTPAELTAQAQSMLIMVVSGLGALVGAGLSGAIYGAAVAGAPGTGPTAWTPLWVVPIGVAVVTAAVWLGLFRSDGSEGSTAERMTGLAATSGGAAERMNTHAPQAVRRLAGRVRTSPRRRQR